ncbi:MAG: nicotinate phosphoribosyltransferase, partial [Tunicatimonas sp.]
IVQKSPTEMNAQGNIVGSFKKSKGGKLKLVQHHGNFQTVAETDSPELEDQLVTVFENGTLTKEWTFEEVRERAAI